MNIARIRKLLLLFNRIYVFYVFLPAIILILISLISFGLDDIPFEFMTWNGANHLFIQHQANNWCRQRAYRVFISFAASFFDAIAIVPIQCPLLHNQRFKAIDFSLPLSLSHRIISIDRCKMHTTQLILMILNVQWKWDFNRSLLCAPNLLDGQNGGTKN